MASLEERESEPNESEDDRHEVARMLWMNNSFLTLLAAQPTFHHLMSRIASIQLVCQGCGMETLVSCTPM